MNSMITTMTQPPSIWISTYRMLRIDVLDDFRDKVPIEAAQAFNNAVCALVLTCNRAISLISSGKRCGQLNEAREILNKLSEIIALIDDKASKEHFQEYSLAVEAHCEELAKQ